MYYNDFIWFVEERENIRLKKETNLQKPWTDDHILANTHFLNIHTKHDTGTKLLHKYIDGMTDWEKLFYIFIYRTVYSSLELLDELTGLWMHDYRNIKLLNIGMSPQKQPYYFHIGKHSSLDQFLLYNVLPALKLFWYSFNRYFDEEILDVEEELSVLFSLQKGRRRMKLLSSILVQDIAMQFPGKVNPDSQCYLSITSRQALKKLPGGRSNRNIEELRHSTGLNYSSLNRALDQWWQYLTRKKYYEETGSLREEWLIKAL